jgi:hypothetical protein
MTYQDTLDWMYSQLPMYQQKGAVAYKADLSNAVKLSNHLGNPQKRNKNYSYCRNQWQRINFIYDCFCTSGSRL